MICLLDTHVLLWSVYRSERLSAQAADLIVDPGNVIQFSAASLWEVSIKNALGRADFAIDPRILRRALLENDYVELAISSAHGIAAGELPPIHRDPFDRMLIAQARVEGFTLLTNDRTVADYGSPARLI